MRIEVLAPHDCGAQLEITGVPQDAFRTEVTVCENDGENIIPVADYPSDKCGVRVDGLVNNKKYTVCASAYGKDGKLIEATDRRILYPNYIPGRCIAYNDPYDSTFDPAGRYFGSPSIVKLENGDIIASHDIFFEPAPNKFNLDYSDRPSREVCVTKIYKSSDSGKTWQFLSDLKLCTFGKLFVFRDKLYIMGLYSPDSEIADDRYNLKERVDGKAHGDKSRIGIGLFCSEDYGRNWSDVCDITGDKFAGGFHKAATPVIEADGRLWTAFDTPKDIESGFGIAAASVSVDDDIMNPDNWSITTPFTHYDKNWPGTVSGVWPYMLEEANAVCGTDGEIYVITRYNSVNYFDEFINKDDDGLRVCVLKADKRNPSAPLEFVEMQHFIGSLSKFTINYDDVSGKYYALVSRATEKHCCQRNILSLVSTKDLKNWKIERDCLNILDLNWYQNCQEAGLYYCDWVIDGNDIIAVCRTSLHDCINYHNSNMITFHRFEDFRERNYNF